MFSSKLSAMFLALVAIDSHRPAERAGLAAALGEAGFQVSFERTDEAAILLVDDPLGLTLSGQGVGAIRVPSSIDPVELGCVAQLMAEVQQLRRERGEVSETSDLVVRLLAHDALNVLAPMLIEARELERNGPGAARRPAAKIREGGRRLAEMFQQALGASGRSRQQEVGLAPLLEGLAPTLQALAGREMRLDLRLEEPLPQVLLDPVDLERALLNLVSNARDASRGRGTVVVASRRVELAPGDPGAIPPGHWVVLSVEDEGGGMGPEALARASEPGYTTKPRGQGTGLGLAGVARTVKGAGGHLRIESALGAGTRVQLWLPALEGTPYPRQRGDHGLPDHPERSG